MMLIEEVVLVSSNKEFIQKNVEGFCEHCGDESKFARLLYADDSDRTFIYGDLLSPQEIFDYEIIPGPRTEFSEFLKAHRPQSFKDCLFLFTVYWRRMELRIEDPMRPTFTPDALLDNLFEDSRGYLVWYYQMEAYLKALFGGRPGDLCSSVRMMDELRELRGLNDLAAFCQANGKDVSRALKERMLFERFRLPMVKPALRLYEVLKNQGALSK